MKSLPKHIEVEGIPVRVARWDELKIIDVDGVRVTLYIPTLPSGMYGLVTPRDLMTHTYAEEAPNVYTKLAKEQVEKLANVNEAEMRVKYAFNHLHNELDTKGLEADDDAVLKHAEELARNQYRFKEVFARLEGESHERPPSDEEQEELDRLEDEALEKEWEDSQPATKKDLREAVLNQKAGRPWDNTPISELTEEEFQGYEEHLKNQWYEKEAEKARQARVTFPNEDSEPDEEYEKPLFEHVKKSPLDMTDEELAEYEKELMQKYSQGES